MFDLNGRYNQRYNQPIMALQLAHCSTICRLNMDIPVCHTNVRSIKNTIGMVMNRLVCMGLKKGDYTCQL